MASLRSSEDSGFFAKHRHVGMDGQETKQVYNRLPVENKVLPVNSTLAQEI